jgi:uncharacterized protein (TIGR04222 family)
MDWVLSNPIDSMPGPQFLVFYGMAIFFTLAVCWIRTRGRDATDRLPPPSIPRDIDPYEVAYLRGGENEVVRVAIFSLMQRGYLQVAEEKSLFRTGADRQTIAREPRHPDPHHLSPMEREVFDWFESPRTADRIFQSTLPGRVREHCADLEQRLQAGHLLQPPQRKAAALRAGLLGAAVILGLGTYKLLAALARGHRNVEFLLVLALVGTSLLVAVCRLPRHTHLGRRYLYRLQKAFEQLRDRTRFTTSAAADPNAALVVGLFGAAVLAGTPFEGYHKMFQRSAAHASCGGGCGSSCGGGGGGGCGGGCGGCGG